MIDQLGEPPVVEHRAALAQQRRDLLVQQPERVGLVVAQGPGTVDSQPGCPGTAQVDHGPEESQTRPEAVGQDAAPGTGPPNIGAVRGGDPHLLRPNRTIGVRVLRTQGCEW